MVEEKLHIAAVVLTVVVHQKVPCNRAEPIPALSRFGVGTLIQLLLGYEESVLHYVVAKRFVTAQSTYIALIGCTCR